MAHLAPPPVFTEEHYLELDRTSAGRIEFYNGAVSQLPGSSNQHAWLSDSIFTTLTTQLQGTLFHAYTRVVLDSSNKNGQFLYPAILVEGPASQISESESEALLAIEIVSPDAPVTDLQHKSQIYRSSPTILDYLIVSEDSIHIEHDTRPDANAPWQELTYSQTDDIFQLPSIGCTLSLARIYRRIEFNTLT